MTLDIIVPHYKEPWEVCKYLFDSIRQQRGVCFDNVRVMVVNDGSECLLDEALFAEYPFRVDYLIKEHSGISATRNYGIDHATADYLMFCDIDDGFLSAFGLHLVFSAMQEGFDWLMSNFVEETYTANNTMSIVRHDADVTFIHGKVYKRLFLIQRNIRFDESIPVHEDGAFNMLGFIESKRHGVQKTIETPFYLWRWNDVSTVRKDKKDFVLKTYESVMRSRISSCEELERRGYTEEFRISVGMTVLNCYYDFQKTSYHVAENAKYLRKAEAAFKEFAKRYGAVFNDLTNKEIAEIANTARQNAWKNGMLMERETLKEFTARMMG